MRMHQILAAAMAVTVFFAGGHTFAAIVNPGGSISTNPQTDVINAVGDLVDEDVRTVTFQYVPPEGHGFTHTDGTVVDVTFRSQVYRDPATQRLSFVYLWEGTPNLFGREGGVTSVSAFTDFSTDVTTELGNLAGTITRSADGATIEASTFGQGDGAVPSLLVVTDATAFDQNGTLSASVRDEFGIFQLGFPETGTAGVGIADVSLTGTFQPVADDGGPGPVNPIPLPAGVWGGMVMLGGVAGVVRRLRRR